MATASTSSTRRKHQVTTDHIMQLSIAQCSTQRGLEHHWSDIERKLSPYSRLLLGYERAEVEAVIHAISSKLQLEHNQSPSSCPRRQQLSVTQIQEPVCLPALCATIGRLPGRGGEDNKDKENNNFDLILYAKVANSKPNKVVLLFLRAGYPFPDSHSKLEEENGSATDKIDDDTPQPICELNELTWSQLYNHIRATYTGLTNMPTVDIISQGSRLLSLVFVVNSPTVAAYLRTCVHLYSLVHVRVILSPDRMPSDLSQDELEARMQSQLISPESSVSNYSGGLCLAFSISEDGQQMAAAIHDRRFNGIGGGKQHPTLLSQDEVYLLLLWWTRIRHGLELSQSQRSVKEKQETTSTLTPSKAILTPKLALVRLQTTPIGLAIRKLTEATKDGVDVELVPHVNRILGRIAKRIDAKESRWTPRFVLAWDGRGRYLVGTRAWDGVAAAIQLVHIAVYTCACRRKCLKALVDGIRKWAAAADGPTETVAPLSSLT